MISSGSLSTFSTARSCCGSTLISEAVDSVPSWKRTVTFLAPATTCRLVRITPLSEMTTPVPPLDDGSPSSEFSASPSPRTCTTERWMMS